MTKKNNILDSLNKLKEEDVYGELLMILYKLKDDEKFSTLSTLIWALDKKNLLNFLTIFEGVELKVPRLYDLKLVVGALQIYQLVQIESVSLTEALEQVANEELSANDLKDTYYKLCHIYSKRMQV